MIKYVALEDGFRLRVEEVAEDSLDIMTECLTVSNEWIDDYSILPDVVTVPKSKYTEMLMQIKQDVHIFAESIQ